MHKARLGHIWHVKAREANERTKQEPQPTQQYIGTKKTRLQPKGSQSGRLFSKLSCPEKLTTRFFFTQNKANTTINRRKKGGKVPSASPKSYIHLGGRPVSPPRNVQKP